MIVVLFILFLAFKSYSQSFEFNKNNWDKIIKSNADKNWIAIFWSLECPPCFKELETLSNMLKKQPQLNVVLVNTDAEDSMALKINTVIKQYQLTDLVQLHFADQLAAQNRYIVDPNWYGELPRSYFFSKSGIREGRSGLVNKEILNNWLL